jgi:hypothetical protein
MKLQYVILILFASSCRSHGPVAGDRGKISVDTLKALPAVSMTAAKPPVRRTAGLPVVFTADLNNDGIPDTITLVSSIGDTATFDTIAISIARFGRQVFHAADAASPWTRVDDWFLDSNKNALPTNKFFLGRGKTQSVLLLFGELDGAGDRDDFSIMNIENNRAKMVLNQNERRLYVEAPISLGDLDGDGRLEFVYRQIFEFNGQPDTLNGKIGTYSPYFAYTVDSNCVLNKPLTIRYNQEHYVFAGFKYDESIEVFYPNDKSKPRLWKR